jgi:hypothetical protein
MPTILDIAQVPPCLVRAASDYAIPVRAMLAVLRTEGGRSGTVSTNKNGTSDHGPFQINTIWAKRLTAQFGVTAHMLTHDFCWSARAGAYILRYEINLAGGSFWDGVGHYHSRTPTLKQRYITAVYRNSLFETR